MLGEIVSLWRHPVKGLTPEPLNEAGLEAGACFPNDRRWAVEVGPSGFDAMAPAHISKMRLTVLARFPDLARVRTRLDDATQVLHVGDASGFGIDVPMGSEAGRAALARFLQAFLGSEVEAKLAVLEAPGRHRFMDSPSGFVSAINLASVREVERKIGRPVDPLRFRANIYYEGVGPWSEDELNAGDEVRIGAARLAQLKPIERCIATHVDPDNGVRDIDMLAELRAHFDRITLGDYLRVEQGGLIARGDQIT